MSKKTEELSKQIAELGGGPNTGDQAALEAQLSSLRADLAARHENLEDVAALYPDSAEAKRLGEEAAVMSAAAGKAGDVAVNRTQLAAIGEAQATQAQEG